MKFKGLSKQEVETRINNNQINISHNEENNSIKSIIIRNTLTFFNFINILLAILVLFTGSYKNLLFMGTIIFNTIIGIYHEIKAKKLLDKIKVINNTKISAIRDNKEIKINTNEIVLDDILMLNSGDQIPCDSELLDGKALVNEAIITGESDDVEKNINDSLYGGSYITQGNIIVKVNRVGDDNYINSLIKDAKKIKSNDSKLREIINKFLKYISFILVPLGLLMFGKEIYISGLTVNEAILSSVAGIIGMIPEGLVLLISVALTLASMNLAKESVLVQNLYSLENLARCDAICLDKTGTITTGNMQVKEIINLNNSDNTNIIANIVDACKDTNQTANALKNYCKLTNKLNVSSFESFSSKTKCSKIMINNDEYCIGAYNYMNINNLNSDYLNKIHEYETKGYRILTHTKNNELTDIIVIEDEIRENVSQILDYFAKQGVEVYIISGDDPNTVSAILKNIEFKNYDKFINCNDISDIETLDLNEIKVIGRCTPEFKKELVTKLQENGKTVAMTGDGVNDVAALKKANFSISFNKACQAAKDSANIILLDDDFKHLPSVVNQGRKVINNIINSSTLFLSKTFLSIILTLSTIFYLNEYPFTPIQLSAISGLCICFMSFLLTLQPNYKIIDKHYIKNIVLNIVPFEIALCLVYAILELKGIDSQTLKVDLLFINYVYLILKISKPYNHIKIGSIILIIIIFIGYHFFLSELFNFELLNKKELIYLLVLSIVSLLIVVSFRIFISIRSHKE